ncbi:MAG TPA: IS91 family transposase [Thermodesulfobacteriota bacterium]|nr:IS91 family transposase [Thermodesulfobacteriota bacterium]
MKRSLEVADIFRAYGPAYREAHELPLGHLRTMRAIETCRTAELGGHIDQCDHCGTVRISYNSCRNRHCPKCQCLEKERWLEARQKDLLPTPYFHVVFTLPEGLRPLALRNQKIVYGLLFKAVSETLIALARDSKHLGAEIGFIAILHTWSQTLIDHPHLHCLTTGGGLSLDGKRWLRSRKDFFIPVKVLSSLFRGKFLDGLKKEYDAGQLKFPGQIEELKETPAFKRFLTNLYRQDWVVYCKPPLKHPEKVVNYLGRYTHRVALSNDRLVKLEGNEVTFRWRDSADNNSIKFLTLKTLEFIRRFLLHVLPSQFVKIRYYGILSHRNRKGKLLRCKRLLGVSTGEEPKKGPKESWQDLLTRITGIDPRVCPYCGQGKMIQRETLPPHSIGLADDLLPHPGCPP